MLAMVHRRHGSRGVGVVRRRYLHGINLVVQFLEHDTKVAEQLRFGVPLCRVLQSLAVNVAERNDIELCMRAERSKVGRTHPANADTRKPDPLRCSRVYGSCPGRKCQTEGRSSDQELSSRVVACGWLSGEAAWLGRHARIPIFEWVRKVVAAAAANTF